MSAARTVQPTYGTPQFQGVIVAIALAIVLLVAGFGLVVVSKPRAAAVAGPTSVQWDHGTSLAAPAVDTAPSTWDHGTSLAAPAVTIPAATWDHGSTTDATTSRGTGGASGLRYR